MRWAVRGVNGSSQVPSHLSPDYVIRSGVFPR